MKKVILNAFKNVKSTLSKKTPLIKMAHKAICNYNTSVTFERTYFEATVVSNGNVEMIGLIDGGPLVNRKVCSSIEDIKEFISSTSSTYQ